MAHSSTTNEWATGSSPTLQSVTSGCEPPINGLLHLHGCSQSGKVSKMVNSSVALLRSRRDVW